MSLAKRIFDGFLGKREKNEEGPKGAEPPQPGKAVPPPPKVVRAETPPTPAAQVDQRRQSQTFHVGAPKLSPASPPTPAAQTGAEPQGSGHMRLMPLRSSGSDGLPAKPAEADPMRRSQTIRVASPAPDAAAGNAAPDVAVRPDPLRQSQTIRVSSSAPDAGTGSADPSISVRPDLLRRSQTVRVDSPPRAAALERADMPGLRRVHLHSAAEPAPQRGVELPLRALVMALPPSLRGPAWTADNLPQGSLFMDPEQLRAQLAEGHVSIAAEEARRYLPDGWLDANILGEVDLDLAEVMTATPIDLIPVHLPRQPRTAAAAEPTAPPAPPVVAAAEPTAPPAPPVVAAAELTAPPAETSVATAVLPVVHLPCAIVLTALPAALRGPLWQAEGMPDSTVTLAKDLLLEQLRSGRVAISIEAVTAALPQGWVAPGARGEVDLDLPAVVGALPPEWLQSTSEEDQEVAAAQAMANLFAPAATAAAPDRQPPVLAAPETLAPPVAVAPAPAPAPAEDGRVSVPAGLVLRALPEAMRGPAWSAEGPTGAVISVPREQLLRQLAAGCVELTLDQARAQLPDGMCSANAQGTLVLDLAAVVAAVPTELMQASGEMDQEAVAAAAMADLFATATAPRVAAPTTPPPGRPPETIAVPCGAILSVLPAALRGPAWRAEGFPDVVIDLPKADVLTQLAAGSVTAALSLLEGKIPAGWLAGDAAGDVTLNLSDVVAAVPPEMMAVQEDMVDEAVAAAQLGQLFVPAAAPTAHTAPPAVPEVAAAAPAEAATALPVAAAQAGPATAPPPVEPSAAPPPPTAANADTSDTRPEPRPVGPALLTTEETDAPQAELLPEWGGIEESWERAPHGVDLNVARAAELMQLPGVGETRAQAIIAYRSAHGHFRSVYDLAAVPGVGPALFRRMTGLSVRNRVDRHAAMEHLLALPADQRPLLARIVEAIRAEFSASGAVLTNREGMPLAISGTMVEASRYAALGSRFFFRARRHLQKFVARASDCIILPGSTPPLLLLSSEDVVVILTLSGGAVLRKRLSRVTRAMREVGWLLSRRAVVLRG